MRALPALLLLLWVHSPAWAACSCFPPEVQARTAQEALQKAQVAVYGRVLAVGADGRAQVLVLESFKGPHTGSTFEAGPGTGSCETPSFTAGEETLLLSFTPPPTACDKLPRDHYLLDAFRSQPATPGLAIQR
ncbi:MAG: hypothetical protein KF891_04405 [Rhizobacter sp.]|nr:hypothetical protein [Rhizobacter sp.]